jgi:hypothetical protein
MNDRDPFAGLEDWAKEAERRVRREVRKSRPREARKPRPETPRSWRTLRLAAAFAFAAIVLIVAIPRIRSFMAGGDPQAYATQAVPSGITVTTTESAKPTSPFAGTPAEAYAVGEKGITLPKATAVTGFTTAEVGTALRKVRSAMITARLDQRMLVGHDPKPLLAMLSPGDRNDVSGFFRDHKATSLATLIHPSAKLDAGERPRVSGRVTYASKKVDNVATLQITANFVWVYAFTGGPRALVTVHDEVRWDVPDPDTIRAEDRGLWVGKLSSYTFGVDCAIHDQGMLAPAGPRIAPTPGSGASEPEDNYMRTDHTLDVEDDCD